MSTRVPRTAIVAAVLVVTRYLVPAEEAATFHESGGQALTVLVARPGCTGGHLSRNIDDPRLWTLTTTWVGVGDYRRALSDYEVKLHAVPLMHRAIDEPTAFEDLLTWTPASGLVAADSDRDEPGHR
jgi:hypothetical protein